jgi:KipI family sensor histidine kinase inhibitor
MLKPRFLNLGDSALTVEFGNAIDRQLVAAIANFDARLERERQAGRLDGIIETVPTFRSLTVIFNPLELSRRELQGKLEGLLAEGIDRADFHGRHWRLPVCYGGEFGPDLASVASTRGLSPGEVVDLHLGQTYLVYMLGFLPGFPFMGDVVPQLHMPRRLEPRVRVPAGSVAITGQQTAIYPWESPGGWQLLGRCPLRLFDPYRPQPALLAPGDRVNFEIIDEPSFHELSNAVQAGSIDSTSFLVSKEEP